MTPKPIIEAYEMMSEKKESFSTAKSSSNESLSINEQLDHISSISTPPEPSSITSEADVTEGELILIV